jgi:hypothetical protein
MPNEKGLACQNENSNVSTSSSTYVFYFGLDLAGSNEQPLLWKESLFPFQNFKQNSIYK